MYSGPVGGPASAAAGMVVGFSGSSMTTASKASCQVEAVFISRPQFSLYLPLHIRLENQCMGDLTD